MQPCSFKLWIERARLHVLQEVNTNEQKKISTHNSIFSLWVIFIHPLTAFGQDNQATQKLTLQECVELAIKTHPQIAMTQAQLKEASAKYKEINANYFPKFNIGTSYSRLDYAPQFKVRYLGDSLNDYQTILYLKQLIYDGGKTRRLKEWARRNITVEEENRRDVQQDLIHSVTKEYYGLIFADNMVNVKQGAVRYKIYAPILGIFNQNDSYFLR